MEQQIQAFLESCRVTQETVNDLTRYKEILISYNEKMNLVAESTLPTIWTRHFLDSAQLWPLIPEAARTLADLGAGAGFPSLVLAILAKNENRNLEIQAIESTGKKADFLSHIKEELKLNVTVRKERIESIKDFKADIVTARAFKPLPELLKYAKGLIKKESICLLLKGKTATEELTLAKKYWTFEEEIHQSRSDNSGRILVIKNLRQVHKA